MRALKLWRAAFYKLLQSTRLVGNNFFEMHVRPPCSIIFHAKIKPNNLMFRYGKTPNSDQMKASGGFCPICQDTYQVISSCNNSMNFIP